MSTVEKIEEVTAPPEDQLGGGVNAKHREAEKQKSWGDKYKSQAFWFTRNIAINYVVNFIIAASFCFAFDTSKLGASYRSWSAKAATKVQEKLGLGDKFSGVIGFIVNFGTRVQLLLCGGHALLPEVTHMKNHKHRIEFNMAHRLDSLQEALGMGNDASKRNIQEYHQIKTLLKSGDTAALTPDDKQLLEKHHISPDDLHFKDHKQPTSDVVKARLLGVASSTVTGILFALASTKNIPARWNFAENEAKVGKYVGEKIVARIPGISRLFNRSEVMPDKLSEADWAAGKKPLTGHQLIGIYFIDDMLLTLASCLGFGLMEHRHDKKQAAKLAVQEKPTPVPSTQDETGHPGAEQQPAFASRITPKDTSLRASAPAKAATDRVLESRSGDYAAAPQM